MHCRKTKVTRQVQTLGYAHSDSVRCLGCKKQHDYELFHHLFSCAVASCILYHTTELLALRNAVRITLSLCLLKSRVAK